MLKPFCYDKEFWLCKLRIFGPDAVHIKMCVTLEHNIPVCLVQWVLE